MRKSCWIGFALSVVLFVGAASAESPDRMFVSKEHRFQFQYPSTWETAPIARDETVLRVDSPDGDTVNVVVVDIPELKDVPSTEFARRMLDNVEIMVSQVLAKQYPDVKLIKKGETTVSQQAAVYFVADYTMHAAGRVLPLRAHVIITKDKEKQYTITFRTPQPFYTEFIPTIQRLALGFQIQKIQSP